MYFKLIHPLTESAAAKLHSLLGVSVCTWGLVVMKSLVESLLN